MVENVGSTGLLKLTSITTREAITHQYQKEGVIHHELSPELADWFELQGWSNGRDWSWTQVPKPVFYFTDGNKAMIFKLAWGGA